MAHSTPRSTATLASKLRFGSDDVQKAIARGARNGDGGEERTALLFAMQLQQSLGHQLGARYSADRCTLDSFEVYNQKQADIVNRLRRLIPSLPDMVRAGRGILFYGSVGTGKDHLLAAMLYKIAGLGISVKWMSGQTFYGDSRDRMDSKDTERDAFANMLAPRVLAISDPVPPAGSLSAWNVSQLYRLMDVRYRDLKATWCSLNATTEQDADGMLSAPVWDRLRENAELFPCFWPSFRQRTPKPSPATPKE